MQETLALLNVDAAAVWATDATAGQAVGAALELRDLVSSGGLRVPAAAALAMGARHISTVWRLPGPESLGMEKIQEAGTSGDGWEYNQRYGKPKRKFRFA